MRYRDVTHPKNTSVYYASFCDRCGFKNGWVISKDKYRKHGTCWLCGRKDFLTRGVRVDYPNLFMRRKRGGR